MRQKDFIQIPKDFRRAVNIGKIIVRCICFIILLALGAFLIYGFIRGVSKEADFKPYPGQYCYRQGLEYVCE